MRILEFVVRRRDDLCTGFVQRWDDPLCDDVQEDEKPYSICLATRASHRISQDMMRMFFKVRHLQGRDHQRQDHE